MLYLISSSDDGRVRSDLMRTFLKTTRESDYVVKSLLSFFSRFWGVFLSVFLYLFLFVVARARAVSLFLFFFRRRQRTRVEKISAMFWTMMMKIMRLLNVCVDVQKDRSSCDLSPGQTRFFLYLL